MFFISVHTFAANQSCQWQADIKIISLSAPVTYMLEQINLLSAQAVESISDFHYVEQLHSGIQKITGGEFISQKIVDGWNNKIVFYDRSQRLTQILSRNQKIKAVEIATRDLNWNESFQLVQEKLLPWMSESCIESFTKYRERLDTKVKAIGQIFKTPLPIVFFLGVCREKGYPKLVILNDGLIKDLILSKTIKTLKSQLSYLAWSQKELSKFQAESNPWFVCLNQSDKIQLNWQDKDKVLNFSHPHILNPGFPQIEPLEQLFDYIKSKIPDIK